MAFTLLFAAQVVGLLLIPFGLPGLWLQLLSLVGYAFYTDFATVGPIPIVVVTALAVVAEVLEFTLSGSFAKRYGGSTRAGWGAIAGGIVGAILGVPIPVIGSVVGAFLGSFVGAVALEWTQRRTMQPALRAGWGALLGRLVATAVKAGIGVAIAAVALFSAFR